MKKPLIVLAAVFLLVAVPGLNAQDAGSSSEGTTPTASTGADLHHACYVPATGTIYMIRTEGTAQSCLSGQHVAVSWNVQGVEGPAGASGVAGEAGAIGPAGAAGEDGRDGEDGEVGEQGPAGSPGAAGLAGPQGPAGAPGADGSDGSDGSDGAQGEQGPTGLQGTAGPDGAKGEQGSTGLQGLAGSDGAQGLKGDPGDGLEFSWNGTQLGVRRVGDVSYSYQDLQGADGPVGSGGGGARILAANATLPGAGTFVLSGDNLMPASPEIGTLVAVIANSSSARILVNGNNTSVYLDMLRQWIWNGTQWRTVYAY